MTASARLWLLTLGSCQDTRSGPVSGRAGNLLALYRRLQSQTSERIRYHGPSHSRARQAIEVARTNTELAKYTGKKLIILLPTIHLRHRMSSIHPPSSSSCLELFFNPELSNCNDLSASCSHRVDRICRDLHFTKE